MAKKTKPELACKSQTKPYKKHYYSDKKVIAMVVSKEEHKEWKHDIGLGPLAKQLMRAYFAGKIQIDL